MNGSIQIRYDEPTAYMTIAQPDRLNALSLRMWQELYEVTVRLSDHPNIHAVVIRGEGREAFSSGADIKEFGEVRKTLHDIRVYDDWVHRAITAIRELKAVSLAMIYGRCVGGGAEIALAADLRFASDSLCMGVTPAKLGIVYGPTETQELMERVGRARALDLLVSGRLVGADEAWRLGLVDFVVNEDQLEAYVHQYLTALHHNSWPAVSGMKHIIQTITEGTMDKLAAQERIDAVYETKDYDTRVAQFQRR